MPQQPTPVISFGAYARHGREPTKAEIAEMNKRAERRREEIRISSLAMIGLVPDGRPLPAADLVWVATEKTEETSTASLAEGPAGAELARKVSLGQ
jgi:hypothetical protein